MKDGRSLLYASCGALLANLVLWLINAGNLNGSPYPIMSETLAQAARSYAVLMVLAAFVQGGVGAVVLRRCFPPQPPAVIADIALTWLWIAWVLNAVAGVGYNGLAFQRQLLVLGELVAVGLLAQSFWRPTRWTWIATWIFLLLLPRELLRHSLVLVSVSTAVLLVLWLACTAGWAFCYERQRRRAGVFLVVLVVLMMSLGHPPAPRDKDLPNIALIVVDTLRPDALGCYGHPEPTSPFLDSLAARGVRYTEAYTPAPWTIPSHASLFTGVSPAEHGCAYTRTQKGEMTIGAISHELVTLAELLHALGYETWGISANSVLHRSLGFSRGFERYCIAEYMARNPAPDLLAFEPWGMLLRGFLAHDRQFVACTPALKPPEGGNAVDLNRLKVDKERWAIESVIDYLRHRPRSERPLFLFVNLWAPHWPWVPPERWRKQFVTPGTDPKSPDGFEMLLYTLDRETPPALDWQAIRQLYNAEVRYADESVERIYKAMEERGMLERAHIVVTSDHGEGFGEPPRYTVAHNFMLDDCVLRVPLIVWDANGEGAGTDSDRLVDLEDVFASILQRVNLAMPVYEGKKHRSLLTLLDPSTLTRTRQASMFAAPDESVIARDLLDQKDRLWNTDRVQEYISHKESVRERPWKYTRYKFLVEERQDRDELLRYDTQTCDQDSLVAEFPEEASRMARLLDEWYSGLVPFAVGSTEADEDLVRKLRLLGYL